MNTQQGSYNTYIGARYVPIFDGQWDNTKAYEPLVIVEYQGNSYTSKTYVPIGAEITNNDYWSLTGNYNAQVEAYRQQVQQLQNSVDVLENNKYLSLNGKEIHFFGDSLVYGETQSGQSSFNIPFMFGKINNCNSVNHAVSGSTITENPGHPYVITQIEKANLSNADYVFIQGGINDLVFNSLIGDVNGANSYFIGSYIFIINAIKSKAKVGCKIIIGTMYPSKHYFNNYRNDYKLSFNDYIIACKIVAEYTGVTLLDLTNTTNIYSSNINNVTFDGVHFYDFEYEYLAYQLSRMIYTNINFYYSPSSDNLVNGDMFTNDSSLIDKLNSYSDIVLRLDNGGKNSLDTVYFEKGTQYTVSFDYYTNINIVPYNVNNDYSILEFDIVKNFGTDNVFVNQTKFVDISHGNGHLYSTFTVSESGLFTIAFNLSSNKELTDTVITNLCISKGKNEVISTTYINRLKLLTTNNQKLTLGNKPYIDCVNGIIKINMKFISTQVINANEIIANIPILNIPIMKMADMQYIIGVNEIDKTTVLFALNIGNRTISTLTELQPNHYSITYAFPVYF